MNLSTRIDNAIAHIRTRTDAVPEIGMILGSGLGDFADTLENRQVIPFSDIPDFPMATVPGHTGAFVFGTRHGKSVVCLQGRLHYYEGHPMSLLTLPVRIMARLGVKLLVLTNAAGGVNTAYRPGDLMLITDHINFSGSNPLMGENLDEFSCMIAQSNGIEDPVISIHYNKGKPFAYFDITQDNHYMQYNIMVNNTYGYAIIYGGNDDIIYYNLLSSIETGDLIGVGGYEIINTQEYFRNPFKGMGYRVYTESGRIDEEIAKAIWWELYYKNVYEGTDLTTVWFYDSKSAANSGLAYGMISQDEYGQEIKYEKLQ